VPVELCITSNIKTITFPSAEAHHFAKLYESRHPVVLCTDDSGVFGTSLSQVRGTPHTRAHMHVREESLLSMAGNHAHSKFVGVLLHCSLTGVRHSHDYV
jgi:hypothetical protein